MAILPVLLGLVMQGGPNATRNGELTTHKSYGMKDTQQ